MKTLLILAIFAISTCVYLLCQKLRKATKLTPDDDLYCLRNFVERSIPSEFNAKFIKDKISEYRENKEMNQSFLDGIETQFQVKYKELAEADEFSPEQLEVDKILQEQALKKKLDDIEQDMEGETKTNFLHFSNREDGK